MILYGREIAHTFLANILCRKASGFCLENGRLRYGASPGGCSDGGGDGRKKVIFAQGVRFLWQNRATSGGFFCTRGAVFIAKYGDKRGFWLYADPSFSFADGKAFGVIFLPFCFFTAFIFGNIRNKRKKQKLNKKEKTLFSY